MSRFVHQVLIFVFTICCVMSASHGLWAGEMVEVTLNNGRVLEAEVAAKTNDEKLWLLYRGTSARLLRPVYWKDVASASLEGRPLDPAALKRLANDASNTDRTSTATSEHLPVPSSVAGGKSYAELAVESMQQPARIANVRFDAFVANWDADPEVDGIVLQVMPVDSTDHASVADGTLRVEVFSPKSVAFQDVPNSGGQTVVRLGEWVRQVNAAEFDGNVATLRLPFTANHPSFDTEFAPHALVHVKLVVPGSGVFESSLDGVRVRPFAPTRDALQRQTGQRFFPTETTGRGRPSR